MTILVLPLLLSVASVSYSWRSSSRYFCSLQIQYRNPVDPCHATVYPLKFQYPDDSSLTPLHSVVLFSCRSTSFHCYAPQYQYPVPNDSYLASSTLCSISTVLHSWLSSSNYGLHSVASVVCPKVLTCSHYFRKFYSIPHPCKEKILT